MTHNDKIDAIYDCLVGNKIKGQRGLIDRVDLCENKIHTLENKKSFWAIVSKMFKFVKIVKTTSGV